MTTTNTAHQPTDAETLDRLRKTLGELDQLCQNTAPAFVKGVRAPHCMYSQWDDERSAVSRRIQEIEAAQFTRQD